MDYIKESIKVETEIFKTFVFVIVVLTAGVYGLWIKLPYLTYSITKLIQILKHHPEYYTDIFLFVIGIFFFLFFVFFTINKYIAIRKLLKQLKQKEDKND